MDIKTDIYYIDDTAVAQTRENAMDAVERVAYGCSLNKKESLQLRLLSEELFGLVQTIAKNYTAEFWIEAHDKSFELHLAANADLNQEKKDQMISVSTSGKNEAAKGIMNKLGELCDKFLFSPTDENTLIWMDLGYMNPGSMNLSFMTNDYSRMWSLKQYSQSIAAQKEEQEEEWDELEKSIVTQIADDVIVGVKSGKVEIVVKKSF